MEPTKHDFNKGGSYQPHSYPPANSLPASYSLDNYPSASCPQGSYVQGQLHGEHPVGVIYSQNPQMTLTMTQPQGFAPEESDNHLPSNYMNLSIFACLCCCWPIGLVAIYKSTQVDNAVRRGDLVAANEASRSAKELSMYSIAFGIVCSIFIFVMVYFGANIH